MKKYIILLIIITSASVSSRGIAQTVNRGYTVRLRIGTQAHSVDDVTEAFRALTGRIDHFGGEVDKDMSPEPGLPVELCVSVPCDEEDLRRLLTRPGRLEIRTLYLNQDAIELYRFLEEFEPSPKSGAAHPLEEYILPSWLSYTTPVIGMVSYSEWKPLINLLIKPDIKSYLPDGAVPALGMYPEVDKRHNFYLLNGGEPFP